MSKIEVATACSKNSANSEFFMVQNTLIIGLGMIGGSLAKALKEGGFSRFVSALDRDDQSLETGVRLQVIDRGYTDVAVAVSCADIIVLAVPVKATASVLSLIKPHLKDEVVISDVGSTKGSVIDAAKVVFGQVPANFIPAHPIAGSEQSGVQAADSQLFVKHKVIITEHDKANPAATMTIARMWQSVGAEVLQMDVEKHDKVLAATSHLPHLLAFSLVDSLAKESASLDIFRYAAGGFRDFTRIAASDPTMWSDVCGANKQAILSQIATFTQGLDRLKLAIEDEDETTIKEVFSSAKAAREHFGKMLEGTAYAANVNKKNTHFFVEPGSFLSGQALVPGDKSISHRAIFLAALADGVSEIRGFLHSEDSMVTVQAFRDMGVVIEGPHKGVIKVFGVGRQGLCPPVKPINLGNSGTSMRLLTGLLAAQTFDSQLIGDDSLNTRPMERVAEPLRLMGAVIKTTHGCAPIYITGNQCIKAIDYKIPMASAQVKSAILFAALYAQGVSTISQPAQTRDHTEVLMSASGVSLNCRTNKISIDPSNGLDVVDLEIPGDFSSAAFYIVAATISPDADLTLCNVGVNPTRIGLIHILKLMGADIELTRERVVQGEAIADIHVRYSMLRSIDIPEQYVSTAIDEFPVIFVAASVAKGATRVSGLQELRYKESDRIAVMVQGLRKLGIKVEEKFEGVVIHGGQIQGGEVDSKGDHRTAMAFAIAGVAAKSTINIQNCAGVMTSFPEFVENSAKAGIRIRKEETNVSK